MRYEMAEMEDYNHLLDTAGWTGRSSPSPHHTNATAHIDCAADSAEQRCDSYRPGYYVEASSRDGSPQSSSAQADDNTLIMAATQEAANPNDDDAAIEEFFQSAAKFLQTDGDSKDPRKQRGLGKGKGRKMLQAVTTKTSPSKKTKKSTTTTTNAIKRKQTAPKSVKIPKKQSKTTVDVSTQTKSTTPEPVLQWRKKC